MKAALISLGSKSSKMISESLRTYFDEVYDFNIKDTQVSLGTKDWIVYNQGSIVNKNFDCVYIKGSYKYILIQQALTEAFSGESYVPLKTQSFSIGHNKVLTHLALQAAKIPMPKTHIFSSVNGAKKFLETANYPLIIKIPNGTQGKGVLYLESSASASSILDTLSELKQPFLIQEYIESSGEDYRLLVINNTVLGYKRKAKKDEKRANIHAGGTGIKIEITEEMKSIAIKSAKAIQADICAVDAIPSTTGLKVIEVNLSPGLQGITKVLGINVADQISRALFENTKKFKKSREKTTENLLEEVEKEKRTRHEILNEIKFKGNNIILPEFISNQAKFKPGEEYSFIIEKEKLIIKKPNKK